MISVATCASTWTIWLQKSWGPTDREWTLYGGGGRWFNNAEGSLLITMLMHASFNTFANKVVAPLFPAPLLNDYGLLPELVGFGAVAVIVVAATRGRLSLHDERRSQESDPAALPR